MAARIPVGVAARERYVVMDASVLAQELECSVKAEDYESFVRTPENMRKQVSAMLSAGDPSVADALQRREEDINVAQQMYDRISGEDLVVRKSMEDMVAKMIQDHMSATSCVTSEASLQTATMDAACLAMLFGANNSAAQPPPPSETNIVVVTRSFLEGYLRTPRTNNSADAHDSAPIELACTSPQCIACSLPVTDNQRLVGVNVPQTVRTRRYASGPYCILCQIASLENLRLAAARIMNHGISPFVVTQQWAVTEGTSRDSFLPSELMPIGRQHYYGVLPGYPVPRLPLMNLRRVLYTDDDNDTKDDLTQYDPTTYRHAHDAAVELSWDPPADF